MIARQLGAECPNLLRRIIVLGTGPRGGEGMVRDDLSVDELDDTSAVLMKAFFTQSEASQVSGRAYIGALKSRSRDCVRQCASASLAILMVANFSKLGPKRVSGRHTGSLGLKPTPRSSAHPRGSRQLELLPGRRRPPGLSHSMICH